MGWTILMKKRIYYVKLLFFRLFGVAKMKAQSLIFKKIFTGCLLLFLYFNAYPVWAGGCPSSPTLPQTFTLNSIAAGKDLPVGADIPGTQHTFSFSANCSNNSANSAVKPGSIVIACFTGAGAEVSNLPGVYSTEIAGIGISLRNQNGQRVAGLGVGCDTRNTPIAILDENYSFGSSVTLSLVKIAEKYSGNTLDSLKNAFKLGVYNSGVVIGDTVSYTFSYAGAINIKTTSCKVNTPIINVALGDWFISDFTGQGISTETKPFSILLECDESTRINAVVSGSADSSQPGTIYLTGNEDNTAKGVGVQLLDESAKPLALNSKFFIGTAQTGGQYAINWKARYIQTAARVLPGIAKSSVTVTFIYD